MTIKVTAFGIARDILGDSNLLIDLKEGTSVKGLLHQLKTDFPAFAELSSLAIAINASYAEPEQLIKMDDEVVIIPPVAGG